MRIITEEERSVARRIYAEMCAMIHRAEYIDDKLAGILYGRVSKEEMQNILAQPDGETQNTAVNS